MGDLRGCVSQKHTPGEMGGKMGEKGDAALPVEL